MLFIGGGPNILLTIESRRTSNMNLMFVYKYRPTAPRQESDSGALACKSLGGGVNS